VRHGARFVSQAENRPGAILARLDDALREQPTLSLCTALCVGIHTDHVLVSSAGHPAPIVVRLDGRIREIGGGGPILGLSAGANWPERTVMVSPDETVLLYTDGVTDTHGETERFGQQRLAELLIEHSHLSPPELLTELEAALDRFQLGRQSDDTAALALRVERLPVPKGTRSPTAARRVNHGIGTRTPTFDLETVPNGNSMVIRVSGEIDHTTADRVAEAFEGAKQDAGAQVVLDLANVTFVDSAGLRALVGIERRARDRATTIRIASPPDHVRAVFRLSGLERLLDRSADRGGEWQDFQASERVVLELPVSDTAPRQARAEVREAIAGQLSQAESEVAVLITSELVTNAVVHAQHQAGDSIGLRIGTGPGRVRVEVADSGRGFEPAELTPDDDAPGGRGLVIVDRGATRWGTSRNDRFSVWFELTQDRAP
jgi:anti-anti-sigma factor